MATLSQRLGLKKPSSGDQFLVTDFYNNWGIVDNYPGIYTNSRTNINALSWGTAQTGMLAWDLTNSVMLQWNGSAFTQIWPNGTMFPRGMIHQAVGTSHSINSTNTIIWTDTCTVPASPRTLRIELFVPSITLASGVTTVTTFAHDHSGTQFANSSASMKAGQGGLIVVAYGTPVDISGTCDVKVHAFTDSATGTFDANATITITEI